MPKSSFISNVCFCPLIFPKLVNSPVLDYYCSKIVLKVLASTSTHPLFEIISSQSH